MLTALLLMSLSTGPASPPQGVEVYACADGPTIELALDDKRPSEKGWLKIGAEWVELVHVKGEAKAVLRGRGHMVRPFNWTDILYAPPGRERQAYQCRVSNAAGRVAAPD